MNGDVVSVCSECHQPLVRVEHGEGVVTFECLVHGERAFHLDGGRVEVAEYPVGVKRWALVLGRVLFQLWLLIVAFALDAAGYHHQAIIVTLVAIAWFGLLIWIEVRSLRALWRKQKP